MLGRGRGYLNATGTQTRFIVFLLSVLIVFSIMLRVFQKLAEIVQFPVFLPVSLLSLLIFVGIAGTIYSHSFIGPMFRIRKAVEQLAQGNYSISLHLRESDDPMLQTLVKAIVDLSEHTRNSNTLIKETAESLFAEISRLQEKLERGAANVEIQRQLELVRAKQELLYKTLHPDGKI